MSAPERTSTEAKREFWRGASWQAFAHATFRHLSPKEAELRMVEHMLSAAEEGELQKDLEWQRYRRAMLRGKSTR